MRDYRIYGQITMNAKIPSDRTATTGFIVFSGYNQRAVVALCRTLTNMSVPYYIVASSTEDTIFLSQYRKKISEIRNTTQLQLDDIVNCIRRIVEKGHCNRYVIAPSAESLNIFLLKHHSIFDQLNCVIPLVSMDTYKLVSDKLSFYQLCQDYSISVPAMIKSAPESSLPFVAKPITDITSDDRRIYPHIILSEVDYRLFQESANPDDFFFQQYIDGESYYLLYYKKQNGEIYKYSQKNLVQQAKGKSIVAAEASSIHLDGQLRVFDKLLSDISFYGLLMVEVKFKDSIPYMIEANPRMWGPSQLMIDAGTNLFISMLNEYCYRNGSMQSMRVEREPALYFWISGFYNSLIENGYVTWHCDRNRFVKRYQHFIESDVYFREDTKDIFEKELTDVFSVSQRSREV